VCRGTRVRSPLTLLEESDNAEGFKQGAKAQEGTSVDEPWSALCLKSYCAKPLEKPTSYVF